ncbi:MAG: MFS transporter [Limnohabitans sp.]|nr:MFS transporter [Limnohabitans sp.]
MRIPLFSYGLLGLPLAFVAMPLYVHLPHLYATRHGMALSTLGSLLLMSRLLDAVIDPVLGRWGDHLYARSPRLAFGVGALSALGLFLGMSVLFASSWHPANQPLMLLAVLVATYTAYSMLSIVHQSWGARLGGNETQRAQIVTWREGFGLVGVLTASVLPTWLGWGEWVLVFGLALLAGGWGLSRCPAPCATQPHTGHPLREMFHPWRLPAWRWLMATFVLSGLSSALPATLVLFFIQDRLQAPELQAWYLAGYFLAAAASLPLWLAAVKRWGLMRSWLLGMLLAVMVFIWTAGLARGDTVPFAWVCALSGLALGADLSLPAALLTGMIMEQGDNRQREGAYLGWWNLASKMNLALAAGLALPLLDRLGYQPGNASPQGLQALTFGYAVLPCVLKLAAAGLLYWGLLPHGRQHEQASCQNSSS